MLCNDRAVNPLGEAICEAAFVIGPGEGGLTGDDMYLPELWKTGRRMTWKDEDNRLKPFAGKKLLLFILFYLSHNVNNFKV